MCTQPAGLRIEIDPATVVDGGNQVNADVVGPEARIKEMGLEVPVLAVPAGCYVPARRWGDLVMTSSISAKDGPVLRYQGRLGDDLDLEQGRDSARLAVLNCVAAVRAIAGSLDAVRAVLRVAGYVSSAPDFFDQHLVVDAASELLVAVFSENGRHARRAIGVAALPLRCSVGIELTVALGRERSVL